MKIDRMVTFTAALTAFLYALAMFARFVWFLSSVAAARKRHTGKDAVYIILISQFPFIIICFA